MNKLRVIANCYRIISQNVTQSQMCVNYLFLSNHRRSYSQIALPTTDREYPSKIKDIVSDISKLTLLEVSELNELLKTTLKISDAPMMGFNVANVAPANTAEDEQEKEEKVVKTSFAVKLIKYDTAKKVQLIKEMKSVITGMNLVQAKKFVENLPQVVKSDLSKSEADQLLEAIRAAGGVCEIE